MQHEVIDSSNGKTVSLLKLLARCPEFLMGKIVKEEATNRKGFADETVPLNVVSVRMGQKNILRRVSVGECRLFPLSADK